MISTPRRLSYTSIDQLNELARRVGYQAHYLQLKPGALRVQTSSMVLGNLSIIHKRTNVPIQIWGSPRKGHVAFMFQVRGDQLTANGMRLADQICYVGPNAELHLVTGDESSEFVSVAVRRELVEGWLNGNENMRGAALSSVRAVPFDPADRAAVLSCIEATRMIGSGEMALEDVESLLLARLVGSILAYSGGDTPKSRNQLAQLGSLKRARDYIALNLTQTLRVTELAKETFLSERSLERVFKAELGVTPSQYLRAQRLEVARRKLVSNEVGSVTWAALESGFDHLGRFSKHFREFFGVLPSVLIDGSRR